VVGLIFFLVCFFRSCEETIAFSMARVDSSDCQALAQAAIDIHSQYLDLSRVVTGIISILASKDILNTICHDKTFIDHKKRFCMQNQDLELRRL